MLTTLKMVIQLLLEMLLVMITQKVKAALANPNVKCYRYFEFLGEFMEYFISISIAGTHAQNNDNRDGLSFV